MLGVEGDELTRRRQTETIWPKLSGRVDLETSRSDSLITPSRREWGAVRKPSDEDTSGQL